MFAKQNSQLFSYSKNYYSSMTTIVVNGFAKSNGQYCETLGMVFTEQIFTNEKCRS